MNLAPRTVLYVLAEDLGLQAYKRYTEHFLNARLKCLWLESSKKLLCFQGKNLFKNILFTYEKIFTIEQKFNKQKAEVYDWTWYKAKAKVPKIQRLPTIFCDGVEESVEEWGYCDSFLHARSKTNH